MGMEGSQSVQHHGRGVKAEGQAGNLGLDASAGQGAETPGQHLLYPPFAALHLAPSTHRTIMTTTTEVVHTTYYNPILISDTSSGGAQRGAEIGAPEHIAGRASLSPLLSAAETTSDYLMLAAQNERKFPLEGRRTPPGISSFVVSLDGHEALFQDQRKESYAGQLNASGSISPMRPCSAETPPAKRSGPGWVQLPRADAGLDQESDGGAAIISQALGWTHGPQVSNGDVDLELPLMGPSSGHSRSAQQEHLVKDEKGKGRAVDAPSSGVARTGDAPSNNLGTLRPKAPLTPATSTEYDHAPTMARLSTHPTTPSRGDLAEHANASSEYAQGHAIRRSSGSPPRKRARAASNESIIDPDVSTATDEGAPAAAAPAGATRPPSVEREGALPSPALSPSMMATADRDQLPRLPGDDAMLAASQLRSSSDLVQRSDTATSALARKVGLPNLASSPELSAFASLPGLFQSFPTLPDEAQRYILFQLLRNASLPVLQHVDQLVSPALRHDFLLELPPELAPLILSYLDAKTLCTLSRVSKSWRQLVEVIEGEHVWKQRMQLDGLWRNDGSEERDMQRIARRRRLLDGNMSSTSESSPSKTFSVNEFLDVFRQNAAAQEQAEGSNVPEGSAGPGHVHALAHLQHPQSSLATPDTSQEHVVPLQPSLGLADASGSRITSWTAADGNDADEEMSDGKQGVKLEDGSEQEVDESLAGRQGVQKLRPHPLKVNEGGAGLCAKVHVC